MHSFIAGIFFLVFVLLSFFFAIIVIAAPDISAGNRALYLAGAIVNYILASIAWKVGKQNGRN